MSEDKNKKKKAADTAANSAKKPKADAQAKKAPVKMNSEKKKPEVRKREMTDRMTSDSMLHQFMPLQYEAVRSGQLEKDPRALALYGVMLFMRDYEYAAEREYDYYASGNL